MATITITGTDRGTAFAARPRDGDERAYRRALRHSRRVRRLRVVLVVLPALLFLGLIARNYLPLWGLHLPVEMGNLVIKGTKITMQEPRITGYTSDARRYEFRANSAAQDITKPDLVELQQIHAKMDMADKSVVRLWADSGLYNMKTDLLTLIDHIHLVSSTGYEARLNQAVVDVNKGNVVSDTPVWIKLLNGFLNAKHLEISDNGNVLRFTDVRMTLESGHPSTKAAQQ